MALSAKFKTDPTKTPEENQIFEVEFTNGTIEQLRDLARFLKESKFPLPESEPEKLKQVIEVAIGWLESVKEKNQSEDES